jgi:hypothetical protein
VHRRLPIATALAALAGRAGAEPCPPAVALAGDPSLIEGIGEVLSARGIALDPAGCPAVQARVERRGDELVIDVDRADGSSVERVVGEPATAATVIESFTRGDVDAPLLAGRAVPRSPSIEVRAAPPAGGAPGKAARGVQWFGAFETSYASDHTSWLGAQVGVCVMLGPVCAASRVHAAGVAAGPGPWKDAVERRNIELLVGIDIPLRLRGWTAAPGFAAGLGQMHTRGTTHDMRSETGGMRAEIHAGVAIPLARRFAVEVSAAAALTQETTVEWGPTVAPLPAEPRAFGRLGVGLRYGGPEP